MSPRHPRRPLRVLLTREIILSDEDLGHAINAVVTNSPDVWKYTKIVRRRERALRNVLSPEQWQVYIGLEEAVNDRVNFETELLVMWAFDQGLREGRQR